MTQGNVRQYDRIVRVQVGRPGTPGISFQGLWTRFNIQLTDSKKPSKGKIQIANLKESSRTAFEEDGARVFLFAGYANADLLFSGDIDQATIAKDGQDIITEIEAADGRSVYQSGQLFQTFDPPLDSQTLLRRLAAAMPIKFGHLASDLRLLNYTQGYTVAGPVRHALDEVTESIGAKWSIIDGELVVTNIGSGTPQQALLISPTTGLLGSPEKQKRGVKFTTLLNSSLKPRRIVKLESRDFNGFYLTKKVTLIGDSGFGSDFKADVECREQKP